LTKNKTTASRQKNYKIEKILADMRRISIESRQGIKDLALKRVSSRKIADQSKVDQKTVRNYITLYGIKMRKGKLSDRVKTLLIRKIEAGKYENAEATARYLKSEYNIEVSGQTIRNIPGTMGLKNYAKPKKPRLNPNQIKNRLIFARFHKEHTLDYWKNVMFTDESEFNLYGPDGKKRVWRRPGSILLNHDIKETVKYGGGSVMVWGPYVMMVWES
jgi:Transposase